MIQRSKRCLALLGLLAMALTSAPQAGAAAYFTATSAQQCAASLNFEADQLTAMTELPFAIELTDPKGQPITDAQLGIELTMPAMPMPSNTPLASYGDGAYRGKLIFTMGGAWWITVNFTRPGREPDSVRFEISRVMMK
jgi:hypothetical protein